MFQSDEKPLIQFKLNLNKLKSQNEDSYHNDHLCSSSIEEMAEPLGALMSIYKTFFHFLVK